MPRKLLLGVVPVMVAALLVVAAAQAIVPRAYVNGERLGLKHEPGFAFGEITLKNKSLSPLTCENFSAGESWNEVRGAEPERGFGETTGYATWDCKSEVPCKVTNENGVSKEGIFATAEGPPSFTEKGTQAGPRHTGNTSLPWNEELTEKFGNTKEFFVQTHNIRVWIDIPVSKKFGGPGEGAACEVFGGKEIAFEDTPTEKAIGGELSPKTVNGSGSGLSPSHAVFAGETGLTEKGQPETGRLNSKEFGPGFTTGELVAAGTKAFELSTAEK